MPQVDRFNKEWLEFRDSLAESMALGHGNPSTRETFWAGASAMYNLVVGILEDTEETDTANAADQIAEIGNEIGLFLAAANEKYTGIKNMFGDRN
jgi:hypothetical protein